MRLKKHKWKKVGSRWFTTAGMFQLRVRTITSHVFNYQIIFGDTLVDGVAPTLHRSKHKAEAELLMILAGALEPAPKPAMPRRGKEVGE